MHCFLLFENHRWHFPHHSISHAQNYSGNGDVGLRQRKQPNEEDLDSVLKHHNEVQTKLAEEMVSLARNMKRKR